MAIVWAANANAQQTNESMDIGGVNRTYVQYLPTGFDSSTESLPVVICLHGLGDVSTNIANIGFNQIGDTARFISVYPQGLNNAFGNSSWANGTAFLSSTADDIGFFHALIDEMVLTHNADPARIYVTGFSMGGIMSHKLACEMNNRVAAIGSMSGTMSTEDLTNCAPTYKTPLIHFHGTADATVPYDASPLPSLELVPATIDFWRGVHTCAATADSTQLADIASDGYTVDRFVYQTCDPIESVELWRINGADHEYFYQPVNDFTESVEIWLFFRQWSHSDPAPAGIEELKENGFFAAPNPAVGSIEVNVLDNEVIELYDMNGQLVLSQSVEIGSTTINLEQLNAGVYLMKLASNPALSQRILVQ